MVNAIKAILFRPGEPAEVVEVVADGGAFRGLLGCEDLAFYAFEWETGAGVLSRPARVQFSLVADDTAHLRLEKAPANRKIVGPRYAGWPIRGAFLVTRIEGEDHTSVRSYDLEAITAQFLPITEEEASLDAWLTESWLVSNSKYLGDSPSYLGR
jgi:hypothetical protein